MRSILILPAVLVLAGGAVATKSLLVEAPVTVPSLEAAPAAARAFTIDPTHSSILFRIKHMDVSWCYGRFADFSGEFTLAEKDAESTVKVSIDAASVDTFNEDRDKHVMGSDFFSVKEFPKVEFASTRVAKKADSTYTISGTLSFHGVDKEVTFDIEKIGEGEKGRAGYIAGFHGELTINRRDFGVETYPNEALSDEVHLIVSIEGKAKE